MSDLVALLRRQGVDAFHQKYSLGMFKLCAEAADRIEVLEAALRRADQFITNGIELGYIKMPDADVPDSAHKTPGIIRAALAPEQPK